VGVDVIKNCSNLCKFHVKVSEDIRQKIAKVTVDFAKKLYENLQGKERKTEARESSAQSNRPVDTLNRILMPVYYESLPYLFGWCEYSHEKFLVEVAFEFRKNEEFKVIWRSILDSWYDEQDDRGFRKGRKGMIDRLIIKAQLSNDKKVFERLRGLVIGRNRPNHRGVYLQAVKFVEGELINSKEENLRAQESIGELLNGWSNRWRSLVSECVRRKSHSGLCSRDMYFEAKKEVPEESEEPLFFGSIPMVNYFAGF
jgi:hypothetical protein